jgi:hypothetical protein
MLKRTFVLLILACSLINAEQIPFAKFGYSDIVLQGPTPIATLFLKVGQNVDPSSSYIALNIDVSPALDLKNSFLTFIVWDKPLLTVRLSQIGDRIVVPLDKVDLSFSDYIKLEVRGFLRITDDRCKDIESNGLYITIDKTSFVYVRYLEVEERKAGIWNFFEHLKEEVFIVIPESLTTTEIEGSVWVYSFLRGKTGLEFKIVTFKTLPDTVSNFVIISRFDKMPDRYKELISGSFLRSDGLIYFFVGKIRGETHVKKILILTGFSDEGLRKALMAFLNFDITASSFSPFLLIREASELPQRKFTLPPVKLSFKDLGFSSTQLRGIGSLGTNYTFKMSEFGILPDKIAVNISATYSPVLKETERAFFNVYFNGALIESRRLSEEGKVNYKFTVNKFNLMKINTIRVEFVFYPSSEECKNAMSNFFCKVDDGASYIEIEESYKPEILSFEYFPGVFGYGETMAVLSRKITIEKIEALARIVYTINSGIKNLYFYPRVIYSDLVDETVLKGYNIIGILEQDDNLISKFDNVLIKPKLGFRLISGGTGKVLYALWDTTSVGIVQIFYGRGDNVVMLITGMGFYSDKRALDAAKMLERKYDVVSGNVGIVHYEKEYFFKVERKLIKVRYAGEKTFIDYFNQYKVFIIGFAWLLTIVFFIYIFIRGRQHAKRIAEK